MNSSELQQQYKDSRNNRSVEDGLEFEDFASQVLSQRGIVVRINRSQKYQVTKGDAPQGVEFKRDNRCSDTKRLSIEIAERVNRDRPWVPSGIMRDDGVWLYVQGNERQFWVFSLRLLRGLYEWAQKGTLQLDEIETIRKFYVPFSLADSLCILKYPDDFN